MTIEEIVKFGTPLPNIGADTFVRGGRNFPKFRFYSLDGEEFAVPTKEYKEFLLEKEISRLEKEEGEFKRTLADYVGKDLPGNLPKLRRYVDEFSSKYKKHSIYIWSRYNATQKTTISRALIRELKLKYGTGVNCFFVLANVLMSDLKNSEFSEESHAKIELYRKADFLVIDDAFTGDKVTKYQSGYQISFLDTFLRERLEVTRKATCFTSNIPVTEIGKFWGNSIQSLMNRSTYSFEFNDVIGVDSDFEISHIFD